MRLSFDHIVCSRSSSAFEREKLAVGRDVSAVQSSPGKGRGRLKY
jgi:hypothetical protein